MEELLYDNQRDQISKIFSDVLQDIFNSFDHNNLRRLNYDVFKPIYENITMNSLSKDAFEQNILKNYQSFQGGITEKGFISFVESCYKKLGAGNIVNFLETLGFNNDLSNSKYRCYNIVFHSDKNISVSVRDSFESNINSKLNNILLKNFGEAKENLSNNNKIKVIIVKSKLNNIITLGLKNLTNQEQDVRLTFLNENGITLAVSDNLEKIIKPKETEYFCQFAIEDESVLDHINLDINC